MCKTSVPSDLGPKFTMTAALHSLEAMQDPWSEAKHHCTNSEQEEGTAL